MRAKEGEFLHKEFQARQDLLGKLLNKVKELAPKAISEYQKRLEERLRQLLDQLDVKLSSEDVIKEVALVAERSDISEEISRMSSHLIQFEETLEAEGAVGRKLEFILQEMFREANTMASKSIHADLNRVVVDFKSELDKFKEQVLNVE